MTIILQGLGGPLLISQGYSGGAAEGGPYATPDPTQGQWVYSTAVPDPNQAQWVYY